MRAALFFISTIDESRAVRRPLNFCLLPFYFCLHGVLANSRPQRLKFSPTPKTTSRSFSGGEFMRLVQAFVVLLCVQAVALADLKVTRKVGSGSYGGQSTVYIKGPRQRTENPGMTTIQQCDLKRTIQISDRTKRYIIIPDETEAAQSAAANTPAPQGPRQTRRGAIVTQTETIVDTGERKTMFGYTARHIKTTSVMDAPPEACNPGHLETESDGWYIDLAAGFSCDTSRPPAPPVRRERPDCVDQVRFKRTGT